MDINRLREDFEELTPDEQLEFMASVGPPFCRSVMADPARRRQMMARCLRADGCPLGRIAAALQQGGITVAAFIAGIRAAAAHLTQRTSPEAPA